MSNRLVATIEQRRSGARVIKFAGVLDERARLDELIEKLGAGVALINLAGVERINSSGARDWVNWLASLGTKSVRPMLIACSPAVVAQLNRVKNFAGDAIVKSFQVPYHCSQCQLDKLLLVYVSDMGAAPHQAPPCSCDGCGGAMAFAEDKETYFAFVREAQRAAAKPKAEPAPELARGSISPLTTEHIKSVSRPNLVSSRDSRPSFSAYQRTDEERRSEPNLPPRPEPANFAYILVIVAIMALLLGTAGVLLYLLMQ